MKVAPKHNFAAKLRQSALLPSLSQYVKWQRAARQAYEDGTKAPPMPTINLRSINLDLTTACNFRCTHCIDWDVLNSGINYVDDELFETLDNMASNGLKSVILIGGGEPTIHRKFKEVVLFLKERNVQIGIVTNGSRGDVLEEVAPVLSKGDWIRLSLDSGANDTFIKMHAPRNRALSLEGICAWVPRIREANPDIQIGFSFIIVWGGARRNEENSVIPNIDEIVPATELARHYRFNYISFKPFLTRFEDGSEVTDVTVMHDQKQTLGRIAAAVAKAKELESEEFKVLESTNLRVLMAGNWRDFTKQPKTCHMMAFRQVLSPLGLFHCPAKRGVANARVAKKDGLTPAKQEATRRSLEEMLTSFDASKECSQITCLYNEANWWIEDLIQSTDAVRKYELPDRADHFL